MANAPVLPGKLGSPGMDLRDDPRADPRMVAAMEPFGLGARPAAAPVDGSSPVDAVVEFCNAAEEGFAGLFDVLAGSLAPVAGVTRSVEVIRGVDGNDITLYLHRPTDQTGPPSRPAAYCTAAGWSSCEAAGAGYMRWRDALGRCRE